MRKSKFFACLLAAPLLLLTGCKKDLPEPVCDGSSPTYTSTIRGILSTSCTLSGCHNSGATNGDFTTYAKLKPFLTNGSFRTQVLTEQTMPQNGTLTQAQLNTIQCWVEQNYPEN